MSVKGGKSSSGSRDAQDSTCHRVSAGIASPSGATEAVTADAAVPMLNRVAGVTGARVTTSSPSEPFGPDDSAAGTDRHGHSGQSFAPPWPPARAAARSTAAAYCGDGAESTTDGTSCDRAGREARSQQPRGSEMPRTRPRRRRRRARCGQPTSGAGCARPCQRARLRPPSAACRRPRPLARRRRRRRRFPWPRWSGRGR